MEDFHTTILNLSDDVHFFGIYDGHGGTICFYLGPEVAIFVQRHFQQILLNNISFTKGNYSQALSETCAQIDQKMKIETGMSELYEIRQEEASKGNCYDLEGESYAGCTVIIVLITKNDIFVANLGDCKGVASCSGNCVPLES